MAGTNDAPPSRMRMLINPIPTHRGVGGKTQPWLLIVIGAAFLAGGVATSFALARFGLGDFNILILLSLLNAFLTLSGLILVILGIRGVKPFKTLLTRF